ncbi:MAG: PriCT-2 domain-containing protein, partial [Bacteroidaceae bacterium]|nr:PriCT-2 domain-containing protein [Bacteroidaceae bacterium]
RDNYGRYVDRETGEVIQQMTLREFCLSDRWKPTVDRLRLMRNLYGEDAKKMPEYTQTKQLIPGATLSALFEIKPVHDAKKQRTEIKSRITCNLKQHTGFICIDIDGQDNTSLQDMNSILRTLRHRTEVALLMRSCSGTGYFALIPIAYPDRHKEHFAALMREYASLGITIDKQCGDVTRVRFGSYDEHPYINEHAIPYDDFITDTQPLSLPRQHFSIRPTESGDELISKIEQLVAKLEHFGIDITNDYGDWYRVGFSLANLPEPYGRQFFHRVSAICPKYSPAHCDTKFREVQNPQRIGIGTFFSICKDYGITLRN